MSNRGVCARECQLGEYEKRIEELETEIAVANNFPLAYSVSADNDILRDKIKELEEEVMAMHNPHSGEECKCVTCMNVRNRS